MEFAFGRLMMSPADFWGMTLNEYSYAKTGYHKRINEEQRQLYNLARITGWIAALPGLKKGVAPSDLITFPWEKDAENIQIPTREEMLKNNQSIFDKWDRQMKERHEQHTK